MVSADEIFGLWKRVAEQSGGGLQLEVRDVLANDEARRSHSSTFVAAGTTVTSTSAKSWCSSSLRECCFQERSSTKTQRRTRSSGTSTSQARTRQIPAVLLSVCIENLVASATSEISKP